ncbi:MAG: GFA family protein [Phenylobacterium sp.]|uniref:GFA family protein n=1 Tax=Phenylobacterium sp. TaxID=1871053 RepID=UPI002A35AAC9|nr:GFA family protein [Phenylobacterium sp.]MDX9996958.1 GFA family protein [Phenylobacterium sp.]
MSALYAGGCLCGQVRWRAAAEPLNVRICHCRNCQRATGGPFFARALFPLEGFEFSGELTRFASSARLERRACARCGTPMFSVPNDPADRIGVSLATLDEPDALKPHCHVFVASKRAWVVLDDGLPQYAEGAPS